MSDLTAAIEAGARHAWNWTRAEEHADGCTGRPIWDEASTGHRDSWLATAAMYVNAAAPLIEAAARANERAKTAADIARAIEAAKPSATRFWDTADASTAYALNRAAAIARQHAQETP